MKKYEAVFILDIRRADDDGVGFGNEFAELIASLGGVMGETIPMGRKQFTYEIDRRKAGLYLDFFFELDPLQVIEIKDKFKLDPRVLRNLIILDERPESPTTNIKLNME